MIYSITPGDDPPVVLVAALGFGQASWQPVIDRLTCKSTVLAYDRPGTGAATPRADARPVSYGVLAGELEATLAEAGLTGPVVLAGHSMGGNVVRVFAGRHPERVAGLIFVDGSLPRLALVSGDGDSTVDGDEPGASPIDMLAGEVEVLRSEVPRVPAVVVSRTPGWWSSQPIPHPALDELWRLNQRELAVVHSAPQLIAEDAGHLLPKEAPGLVAYGIDLVVQAVRSGTDPAPRPAELAAVGGRLGPDPSA